MSGFEKSENCSREVLLDDEDKGLLTGIIGSIEVECLRTDDDRHIVDRILLLPPSGEGLQIRLKNTQSLLDDDESICNPEEEEELLKEESIEVDAGFIEQLAVAILEGCHCGPCAPYKSALRTGKKHVNSSGCPTDRGVSFSCLQIREFNMTLGDHPSAVSGPPVALDWDSQAEERIVNLDEYERTRNPRRKRRQLKLSYKDRKKILEKQRGFTTDEVNQAWAEALKIRQQRKETLQRGTLLMMWDEFSESTLRKYNRMLKAVGFQ